ncbi:MAG: C1 family peptidase [Eubacteriales bacterium]|nr:C1 family peptidase [Eubacteriales bacterium]
MINQIYAQETVGEVDLPSRYDARELGLVSAVKNQGRSNACWAHAAMSSVETALPDPEAELCLTAFLY